ncbi:MAG: hypothetical protein HYY93_11590 [Planctomycetes bacterium]|nr:hypothetical protein [Planctomycetota bacterium]
MSVHEMSPCWEKKMFWVMLGLSALGAIATHEWARGPLASEQAVREVARIESQMRESAPPAWSVGFRATDLDRQWGGPLPAEPGDNWTPYKPTTVVPHPVKGPVEDIPFPVPQLSIAACDFSAVRVEWDVPPVEAPLGVRVLAASGASLLRRGPGDQEFRVIEESVDPESGTVRDPDVLPRRLYEYRLRLTGKGRTAESEIVQAALPDDRGLRWLGGRGGLYILAVRRWFGPTLGWLEETFNVRIGKPIGGEVSRRIGGKRQTLDFGTGWVLRGFRAGGALLPGAPGLRSPDALEYGDTDGEVRVITQEDPVANGR